MTGTSAIRRSAVVAGREAELGLLGRAVQAARGGQSTTVLLAGEGGVGKTRLLGETAATSRRLGLAVLSGRAPITTPVAFSVVAEALRSWLRGHELSAPAPFDRGLRLVLPEWPCTADGGSDLSDAQLRLLSLEGIVHVLRGVADANRGAVVLLDDLHAADAESLEAFRYLSSAAVPGLTLVGALRPGEATVADELVHALRRDGTAELVDVAPLDARAVAELVAALLDAQAPDALVDDIVSRTDGVPLLVEEVLDAHLRAGSVRLDGGLVAWRGGSAPVPKSVREMVSARMEHLPREHREVLVAGAVIGDFTPSLLSRVTAHDDAIVGEAIAGGVRAGLLETAGGAVDFRHAVIREAVRDAALPHVIELAHRRAAAALEDIGDVDARTLERRAQHLRAVGERDRAALLLVEAADARLREHSLLGAEQLAEQALAQAAHGATSAAAADALARALAAQGRWADALDVDSANAAQHGETAACRERMALCALEAGRPDDAREIIARALDAGDSSLVMQIAAGRVAIVGGEAQRALAVADAVFEEATHDGDLDVRLQALELRGRAFDFLGRRGEAEQAWEQQASEAAAAGRTQAQLRAVVHLGKVELFAGKPPKRLHEAVELARAAGALVELAWAQENLGIALGVQGDLAAAAAVFADAVPRARALRLDQLAYLLASDAMMKSYGGASTEAVEEEMCEAERMAPTADLRLHTSGMRGDIALRDGRYEDAIRWFGACEEILAGMPGIVPSDSGCWLVWALAAAGRRDDASRALENVREMPDLARWYGRPVVVAAAEALLKGDADGVDQAIASATGNMPWDIALMRVIGAEVLGGEVRVRWLREALDTYEARGAVALRDRVRRLLREAGGAVPRRRRSSSVPEGLAQYGVTPREAEVLSLLGGGMSNGEIAERLFVSVRTVETHVSSLLTKLDARNRGQLTALSASLARHG